MQKKLSSDLRQRLAATPEDESIEVVVELGKKATAPEAASGDRAQRIAAMKQSFSAYAAPIEKAIEKSGGKVLDRAWINQTIKAELTREAVEALGEREDVERVDTPRSIQTD
jgi:hypothetical protein